MTTKIETNNFWFSLRPCQLLVFLLNTDLIKKTLLWKSVNVVLRKLSYDTCLIQYVRTRFLSCETWNFLVSHIFSSPYIQLVIFDVVVFPLAAFALFRDLSRKNAWLNDNHNHDASKAHFCDCCHNMEHVLCGEEKVKRFVNVFFAKFLLLRSEKNKQNVAMDALGFFLRLPMVTTWAFHQNLFKICIETSWNGVSQLWVFKVSICVCSAKSFRKSDFLTFTQLRPFCPGFTCHCEYNHILILLSCTKQIRPNRSNYPSYLANTLSLNTGSCCFFLFFGVTHGFASTMKRNVILAATDAGVISNYHIVWIWLK